jgi:zinc transport system substrate-binding protein
MCHTPKTAMLGLAALCTAGLFSACNDNHGAADDPSGQDEKLRVTVSVPPLADLVRKVGGQHLHIDVLVDNGQDPHTFSPTPVQMKALGRANILFTVGMPFEQLLVNKISAANTGITVIDTSAGLEKIELEHHDHEEESLPATGEGEPEDPHAHHEHDSDPHIWLAPSAIKVQLDNIQQALAKVLPGQAETFTENLNASKAQLEQAHAQIAGKLKPFAGRKFFVFHPAFDYFAHEYGLEQVAIEIGGNSPTPKELIGFLAVAKEAQIRVIFVQPQFDPRSAEVIATQLGAKVATLDPLAPDVIANLHAIADAIVEGFSESKKKL